MLNICIIEGFLTRDPVIQKTGRGKDALTFVIASHRDGYGKGVDYIKCKAFNYVARAVGEYKRKGDRIIVLGALRSEQYENYKGQDVYELVLNAWSVKFQPMGKDSSNVTSVEPKGMQEE